MSSELDTKCESPLGFAIESALGVRTCDVGAVYVLTVKSTASELFFYKLNPDDGSVIYKINLWTVVDTPGEINNIARWNRIVVDASGTHVYINRGSFLTKVKTGITIDLADRVVWDVLSGGGEGDLSLPPDGDPRWGAGRLDRVTGDVIWGAPSNRWNSVGFDNKLHISQTSRTSGFSILVQQLDVDGVQDWVHVMPASVAGACGSPATFVLGIGTTKAGRVWVGWTFQICVATSLENRYRERVIDSNGTLFTALELGESPSIEGPTNFLVSTLSKTGASWLYTQFSPLQRRIKRLTDTGAEVDTTNLTSAQFPLLAFVRGNTGTYSKSATTDTVKKTTDIFTTDIWTSAIDSGLDGGNSVSIGVKD